MLTKKTVHIRSAQTLRPMEIERLQRIYPPLILLLFEFPDNPHYLIKLLQVLTGLDSSFLCSYHINCSSLTGLGSRLEFNL